MTSLVNPMLNTLGALLLLSLISFVWSLLLVFKIDSYSLQGINQVKPPDLVHNRANATLPSLIIAPICIFIVFKVFRYNLTVTPDDSNFIDSILVFGSFSFMLFLSSGMFTAIKKHVHSVSKNCKNSNFFLFSLSLGINLNVKNRKLVLCRSLSKSYLECVGLMFCELFVLEPLLNFHGLADTIWASAQKSQWIIFLTSVLIFLIYFYASLMAAKSLEKWVNKRLKGYNV